jgi:hypothetical protein
MIRLKDLLFHEGIAAGQGDGARAGRSRDIWRVDPEDSSVLSYGARNSLNQVRYFDNEEDARKFARGEIEGPHSGKPEPKQRATPVEKKQTYKYSND